MKERNNELVIFTTQDGEVKLDVNMTEETVWLTQSQMAMLFDREISTVSRHINNAFKEEVDKESNLRFLQIANSDKPVAIYSLDVIISVGYRVKSQRGVEFRRWANSVLKEYILKGYAVNDARLKQLNQLVQLMKRTGDDLDGKQILSVIENYSTALDMLDDYDHQVLRKPKGRNATYVITYQECRDVIDKMRFGNESSIFGNEKDESFKGSIGAIYQTFGGKDVYPSLEEKAANLLYFVTKNHSFSDGNKRIAATMFLYFLDKNGALYVNGVKSIDDFTLVSIYFFICQNMRYCNSI